MNNDKTADSRRRRFLLSIGLGGAGAAAGAVVGKTLSGRTAAAGEQGPVAEGKGYRLSEHVRNYYRTART